jgi:hypothetical protein
MWNVNQHYNCEESSSNIFRGSKKCRQCGTPLDKKYQHSRCEFCLLKDRKYMKRKKLI